MRVFSIESVIDDFKTMTKSAGHHQRETLRKILEQNGKAEYLQNLGLGGRTDPESYKACVPLVTHGDLEPYIQRISDGDSSPILTGEPITSISLSSGTTQGKRKYLPFNEELVQSTMQIYRTSYAFRNRMIYLSNNPSKQVPVRRLYHCLLHLMNTVERVLRETGILQEQKQCCQPGTMFCCLLHSSLSL